MAIQNESVAIWLGKFTNKKAFDKFIKVHYNLIETSKNLNIINSVFDNYFKLDSYNRDIVEVNFNMDNKSLFELLNHASYLEEYISTLSKENCDYNCVILIYDYFYDGSVNTYDDGKNNLVFFKNLDYKKTTDVSIWVKRARERMREDKEIK